jgi:hypothetical protein
MNQHILLIFNQELYEPLWEDLELLLSKRGRKIRSIWIANVSNQGASGLLNEETKFDDGKSPGLPRVGNQTKESQYLGYDHSRDLLHMISQFQKEMIKPIVGVGHSMGGNQQYAHSSIHSEDN